MDITGLIPLLFVIGMVIATVWLGVWATKISKTSSDFFVAARSVSVGWNASAISGEYLSAASFMGVAGLVMKFGYDPLWYPACYAAGYLFLLLFIAGPLRRFGAYTIPDFAEGRFDSPGFRKVAVTFVLFIGFFYTMPQMKGAGLTMQQIMGWPYWVGIAVVGSVITFNVAIGGMKGITFVQAFQYWAKMFAISAPLFVLVSVYGSYHGRLGEIAGDPAGKPVQQEPAKVKVLSLPAGTHVLQLPDGGKASISEKDLRAATAGAETTSTGTRGLMIRTAEGGSAPPVASADVPPGGSLQVLNEKGPDGAAPPALSVNFATPTAVSFSGAVPGAPANKAWIQPFGPFTSKNGYPLLYTYSLIIALVCGTAGLPHILVRFYTNPDGRAAKRTTFWVMVLIGVFYMFTPIWGTLGRMIIPHLYATGKTDAVVIDLPRALDNKLLGAILSGITSAGAFAAFMSTFSGLLVSMSGALAHDIYGKMLRPNSSPEQRMGAFKVAAIMFGAIAMFLGYLVEKFDIAKMVGWAFAIGAASYFPLLLMGSWWRGLTKFGAGAGMLLGGLLSVGAIVYSMLIEKGNAPFVVNSKIALTLMEQPAIWAVPLSLITMFVVSKLTTTHIPRDVNLKMLRLHAPEELGLSKNYIEH